MENNVNYSRAKRSLMKLILFLKKNQEITINQVKFVYLVCMPN